MCTVRLLSPGCSYIHLNTYHSKSGKFATAQRVQSRNHAAVLSCFCFSSFYTTLCSLFATANLRLWDQIFIRSLILIYRRLILPQISALINPSVWYSPSRQPCRTLFPVFRLFFSSYKQPHHHHAFTARSFNITLSFIGFSLDA